MQNVKLGTELASVSPDFNIKAASNGWVIEFSGRNSDDGWVNITILCDDIDTLTSLIVEHSEMEKD